MVAFASIVSLLDQRRATLGMSRSELARRAGLGLRTVQRLTPIDVSGLIPKAIANRAALNVAEATNIARALVKYLAARPTFRQAPFTLPWLYILHREMISYVANSRRIMCSPPPQASLMSRPAVRLTH